MGDAGNRRNRPETTVTGCSKKPTPMPGSALSHCTDGRQSTHVVTGSAVHVVEASTDRRGSDDPLDLFAGPDGSLAGIAAELAGLAYWSTDGTHLWWSEQMSVLAGYPPRSGRASIAAASARIVGEDLQALLAAAARCRAGTGPEQLTVRGRSRDGRLRHLRVWLDLRRGRDRGPDLIWGACLDLSDEHDRLDEMRAGREEVRLAFDQAPIGMVLVSRAPGSVGRVVRMNDTARDALDIRDQPLTAVDLVHWVHPDQQALHHERKQQLLAGTITRTGYEVRYRHRSGQWRDAWVRAVATHGDRDAASYVLYHLIDVTTWYKDRRKLERQAFTDPVTGQGNRQLLAERTQEAAGPLAVLMVDVDGFRQVNAVNGQAVGDLLLVELGQRLRATTPPEATVGRLDGDTFAVLLPQADPADLALLVHRLHQVAATPVRLPTGAA